MCALMHQHWGYETLLVGTGVDERCAPQWCSLQGLDPPYPITHEELIGRCILSCTRFCSDQIKYHQNSTFVMRKIGCFVNLEALLVVLLGGSFLKVDLAGLVKKKSVTSGFGSQVILGGSIYVSGPFTLHISCGTIYNLA